VQIYEELHKDSAGEFTTSQLGSGDGDDFMESGEVFEVDIPNMTTFLTTDLTTDETCTLEVVPPRGAVLYIQRTLPNSLEALTTLE